MATSSAGHGRDRRFRFLWICYVAMVGWCSEEFIRVSYWIGYILIVGYHYALLGSSRTSKQLLYVANFYPITEFKF